MSIQRTRSARELVALAGRWPSVVLAVAVLNLATPPLAAYGQAGKPANPMKDKADPKVAVSDHMTVDLHVKDEDLINVLELLSIQTQKNIIASKGVSGKVTATLYGVTFYQALDAILHVNGFGYIENGNFIYVYTKDELKQIEASLKKRVTKMIRLNYLNADDAKTFVEPLLSKDGGEIKTSAKTAVFNIPDKAPVGKNDYALSEVLVVIDFEENVKAIEELVKQLDTKPAQVLVEATILQTALNEQNAFGVDFSVIGDLDFTDFLNVGGPLSVVNSLIRGGSGTSGGGVSPPDNRGTGVVSNPGNTGGPGTFKVGVVAGDVSVFVRLLDQVTDTVVLSNPKILALNRQPARVLVGKRVGYLNTTSTETSTTQTVEFLDTGTQLYFRPFVSSDGEVRMELKPQVSAAEIRDVTDARGAAVTIPDEVTQELVTNVNVKDGQTVVLGGLFTESSSFTRRQVPWLGDIPVLGAAFRGNDDQTQRSEIIFLITPTIVSDAQLAATAERAAGDMERIRTGTRQGLLPWSREKMTDQLNVEAEKFAREGNYERALFNIQRSLSLSANQPEVYRLRERISNQHERWNNPSMLDYIVNNEVAKRVDNIRPMEGEYQHDKPKGSVRPVLEPVKRPDPTAPGSNKTVIGPEVPADNAVAGVEDGQHSSAINPADALPTDQMTPFDVSAIAAALNGQAATQNPSLGLEVSATGESNAATNAENAALPEFVMNTETGVREPAPEVAAAEPAASEPIASEPMANESTEHANANAEATTEPVVNANADALTLTATTTVVAHEDEMDEAIIHLEDSAPVVPPSRNALSPVAASNPSAAADQQIADTRQQLTSVRSQIELYGLMNAGTLPAIGFDKENGWAPLTEANLLRNRPKNAYIGGPNAEKVIVRETADTAYHTNYGWIFNPKTGQIWAAGFDVADKPIDKSAAPANAQATPNDLINAIAQPAAGTNTQNQPNGATTAVPTENPK